MEAKQLVDRALEHHGKGELDEAEKLYREAIQREIIDKRVFTNLAAILRSQGDPNQAAWMANQGLQKCDNNSPILLNTLGNALRDLKRHEEAINVYRKAIKHAPEYFDPKISLLGCLYDGGYTKLFDLTLRAMIKKYGADNKGLMNQAIIREVNRANTEGRELNKSLEDLLLTLDSDVGNDEKIPEHWYLMSQLCCKNDRMEEAEYFYNKGISVIQNLVKNSGSSAIREKADKLHTISSWNFACALVRYGNFKLGWKLYDYGLQTPAKGPQRWQRSLYKPFSFSKVKMWRGENLSGKHILLLGEQGIGDSMMFITLIPRLINEGAKITLIVPERLFTIYKRTLKQCNVIGDKQSRENTPDHREFDYQCPLGSIVQYRYKSLEDFDGRKFELKADKDVSSSMRNKYLRRGDKRKLIGISWQGGGTKDRINDKSVNLKKLLECLKKYNVKIISLQYGDDKKIVSYHSRKCKVDFIDDEEVEATKDMDKWLSQVQCCDAIISIANTTIHGAGGLNKPTLCLLGHRADWRWLKDRNETHSYWYPTVEIAWQSENGEWDSAFQRIGSWLKENDLV